MNLLRLVRERKRRVMGVSVMAAVFLAIGGAGSAMKRRIATLLGAGVVSVLLLLGLAGPSEASTRWNYRVNAEDLTVSIAATVCTNPWDHYNFKWDNVGDKVFLRDCAANRWGTRIKVDYRSGGRWVNAGTLHDPSAGGDGGWKPFPIPEQTQIRLRAWEYRGDNRANYVRCIGLNSSDDRIGDCTDPVD